MDEGLLTGNVFIDLKKALDDWFESYLGRLDFFI